jgi:tetratricopeptide (TPR) repeat protein
MRKQPLIVCILLVLICARIFGQENNRGGIVYGPKAAFNISAPQGWILDTESGVNQGMPCVLYPQLQRDLAVNYGKLGGVLVARRDFVGAKIKYTSALEITQKLGIVLASQSDLKGAEAALTSVLRIRQKLAGRDLTNGQWQHDLALAYKNLGIVLKGQGNTAEAETDFRASLKIFTDLIQTHGEDPLWKADLDLCQGTVRRIERSRLGKNPLLLSSF